MLDKFIYTTRNRSLILLLVFFLVGCSSPVCTWQLTSIQANCPPTTYYKIYAKPCSTFSGLEAEFVWNGAERHFYLNAHTLLLPTDPENCGYTTITLMIEEEEYTFSAILFDGQQRVLLPAEAHELIVCALLRDTPVMITIGRYQQTLEPDNFPSLYTQLGR